MILEDLDLDSIDAVEAIGTVYFLTYCGDAKNKGFRGVQFWIMISVVALLAFLTFLTENIGLIKLYAVIINLFLLTSFCYSLFHGPSMIYRFAMLKDKSIPDSPDIKAIESYCITVTRIWCGFFILNASISAITVFLASDLIWGLYNGFISYILIGALLGGEYLFRKMRKKVHLPNIAAIRKSLNEIDTPLLNDSADNATLKLCFNQKSSSATIPRDFPHINSDKFQEGIPGLNLVPLGYKTGMLYNCMSNSYAFGGCNVGLIIAREEFLMINTPLTKPELFKYSPHKDFMLLLDRLEDYSLETAYLNSSVDVTQQSVFFDSEMGVIPCWISFEYMAQSIALLSGISSVLNGQKPKIGFIMGIRDFDTLHTGFTPGSRVDILVQEIFRDGDVAVFEGKAEIEGELVAKGTISTVSASNKLLKQMMGKQDE